MKVLQLLDELDRRVPKNAPAGTCWKGAAVVTLPEGGHRVAAAVRIDIQGRRREQFWCDDVRVDKVVLLRLTCPERECPHAIRVREQWLEFHGQRRAEHRPAAPQSRPLMAEVVVRAGQQCLTARPARFPCFTPCPHGAHPPLTIDKSGFDLFDNGLCLGGGVMESDGVRRPRLPTLRDAEAYLHARALEALVVVGTARDASRKRPGTADGAD